MSPNAPRRVTAGYPYPSRKEDTEFNQLEYDMACSKWARGLTEVNLRSLTADYLRGNSSDDCRDAYEEFQRRERLGLLSDSQSAGSSLKSRKSRSGNQSRK